MAVGQRLSLKQSQTLALTPGLRQSIELMQLSAGDLQALVQRKLEENPFLEREERGAASDAQATPDITMPELAARLMEAAGVSAAPAVLSRFLCRLGFTYKKSADGVGMRTR